jgi:hypothetical protein
MEISNNPPQQWEFYWNFIRIHLLQQNFRDVPLPWPWAIPVARLPPVWTTRKGFCNRWRVQPQPFFLKTEWKRNQPCHVQFPVAKESCRTFIGFTSIGSKSGARSFHHPNQMNIWCPKKLEASNTAKRLATLGTACFLSSSCSSWKHGGYSDCWLERISRLPLYIICLCIYIYIYVVYIHIYI